MFIDEVTIYLKSGDGGNGCESYHKRSDHKFVPNGGDGGKGGDVIIRADDNINSLSHFKSVKHFRAEAGGFGKGNNRHGKNGTDLIIKVPCGTVVYNRNDGLMVRDLRGRGEEVVVLKGGRGGMGNQHGKDATYGHSGEEMEVTLTHKIIADIFLVGMPNSGKTRLLDRLTHAKAKVELYPFSTQSPQLGVYEASDYSHINLCDLPALCEGASEGKGLGNRFLKHLERARLIFYMLDPLGNFSVDLRQSYNILLDEVSKFNGEFKGIPHFIVINKIDIEGVREKAEKQKSKFRDRCFLVSAETGEGIKELMKAAEKELGL